MTSLIYNTYAYILIIVIGNFSGWHEQVYNKIKYTVIILYLELELTPV